MSYSALGAFSGGRPEVWGVYTAETDEVYVFTSFTSSSQGFQTGMDLKAILDAAATAIKNWRTYKEPTANIVGIIVMPTDAPGQDYLSVICRYNHWSINPAPDADEMEPAMETALRQRFPDITLSGSFWQYYDDENMPPNISFWLAEPLLWDSRLGEFGAITPAGENLQGMYQATNEDELYGDSRGLKPWPGTPRSGLGPLPPLPPPSPNGPEPNGPTPIGPGPLPTLTGKGTSGLLWLVGGGIIIAWGAAYYFGRKKK